MGLNNVFGFSPCLFFAMALLTFAGCRAEKSNAGAALTDIETELKATEEDFENAVEAELSPNDPQGVLEHLAELERLSTMNLEAMTRMRQLVEVSFPKSEKARFDLIMSQLDERGNALREKLQSAREVVDQIKTDTTKSPAPDNVP